MSVVRTLPELRNRARVAARLAEVLVAHGSTAADAEAMPLEGWQRTASLAGMEGYSPSIATRSVVVRLLSADVTPIRRDS